MALIMYRQWKANTFPVCRYGTAISINWKRPRDFSYFYPLFVFTDSGSLCFSKLCIQSDLKKYIVKISELKDHVSGYAQKIT